jgi:hypothetical protein
MRFFFTFFDTGLHYSEEPSESKVRLSFGIICFILFDFGLGVEGLGILFESVWLTMAGFLIAVIVAVCYLSVLAYNYFTGREVIFY